MPSELRNLFQHFKWLRLQLHIFSVCFSPSETKQLVCSMYHLDLRLTKLHYFYVYIASTFTSCMFYWPPCHQGPLTWQSRWSHVLIRRRWTRIWRSSMAWTFQHPVQVHTMQVLCQWAWALWSISLRATSWWRVWMPWKCACMAILHLRACSETRAAKQLSSGVSAYNKHLRILEI